MAQGKPARAALYARTATSGQGRDSADRRLQEQWDACARYCEAQGFAVVTCYGDVATGATGERPEFRQLLEAARAGALDIVVCTSVERLGRRQEPLAEVAHATAARGVRVHTPTEGPVGLRLWTALMA